MRWRNGTFSANDFAHEHWGGGGNVKTYQPGELLLPVNPRPGLRSGHQAFLHEMSSKAVSSSSQLKAAVPAQRASVEE